MSPAKKGRPASISTDEIIRAGLAVTRESGLAALSMQSVARHLGVTTRSLYHHVRGIAEVRNAVVNRVISEPIVVPDGLDPHDWLLAYARATRAHLAEYPGVAAHVLDVGWLDASVLDHLERCTSAFEAAGIATEQAVRHGAMFLWWIATFVAREISSWEPANLPPAAWESFPGRLPRLLAKLTVDDLFEFELGQVVAVTRPAPEHA